ncbi:hypothetical protein ACTXMK_05380 [Psychrobacter celer]|uniref:hypothetical protein n=1 Tax=Psychrobacter celer TaxID=306572 RepID=UPI003FD5EF9D
MGFVKDAWNGITGKTGAKAAKEAGQMQADSSKYAADIAQKQFEQTRQDQMPWLNAGKGALGQLQNHIGQSRDYEDPYADAINKRLAGLGGGNVGASRFNDTTRKQIQANYDSGKYTGGLSLDEFEADPGYNFRKSQGMDGIESSAAASGGLLSGAALKSLNRYNSDLASQEYGNAWQRDQAQKQQQFGVDTGLRGQDHSIFADNANRSLQAQIANQNYGLNALNAMMNARSQDYQLFSNEDSRKYNQYANMAGVGQQTAGSLGQFGAQNAQNQGNLAINGANAQANALIGSTNAKLGGMSNLLGLGSKALGMFI